MYLEIAFAISLFLPLISSYYFNLLMKFIKVRRGNLLICGAIIAWLGYIFFMLPWIFIKMEIPEIRAFSYLMALLGLSILLYGIIKIYVDWKEVIK